MIIEHLSNELKKELLEDHFNKIFKNIPLFKNNFSPIFLNTLCFKIKELTFAPDE